MRGFVVLALAALASCATAFDELPEIRYAYDASRGALLAASRPSNTAAHAAHWRSALSDTFSCRVAMRTAVDAALVGALEVSAANAVAQGRGSDALRWQYRDQVVALAEMAREGRARPSGKRCSDVHGWAARTGNAGRRALEQARRNGVIREEDDAPLVELLRLR